MRIFFQIFEATFSAVVGKRSQNGHIDTNENHSPNGHDVAGRLQAFEGASVEFRHPAKVTDCDNPVVFEAPLRGLVPRPVGQVVQDGGHWFIRVTERSGTNWSAHSRIKLGRIDVRSNGVVFAAVCQGGRRGRGRGRQRGGGLGGGHEAAFVAGSGGRRNSFDSVQLETRNLHLFRHRWIRELDSPPFAA